ncbi:Dynein light chain Tctex-type 1 [Chionoecetes opilio]|uniref:Dynein light chain Tctex-type 1 n=1 Tax=Chionoecetes opilio TaxID=41210 RepID=A0A8J8WFD4_CHIOP|nr:Dynein light chain Tctex-type 1 [Chionoecetes opilio]
MEDVTQSEEHQFVVDEVSTIIKESIETVIGGNAYTSAKVNSWTAQVVENVLGNLSKLNKAFKYIVPCVIMQKNGAGLHTASSCYWNNDTDGSCTVPEVIDAYGREEPLCTLSIICLAEVIDAYGREDPLCTLFIICLAEVIDAYGREEPLCTLFIICLAEVIDAYGRGAPMHSLYHLFSRGH